MTDSFPTLSRASAGFERLAHEHSMLLAQYGSVQARCSRIVAEQARDIHVLQAEVMRLRAAVIVRESALAFEREDRARLEASIPGLPKRVLLAKRVELLLSRIQDLMRERLRWQVRTSSLPARPVFRDKAVLCVGQDASGATLARQVVERAGGQFLRHDGMDQDHENHAALEASLVAADLVICQTGCVSHNAYWRVQDHCKRTGKPCVLVDQPQALQRVWWAEMEKETTR